MLGIVHVPSLALSLGGGASECGLREILLGLGLSCGEDRAAQHHSLV